jgi:hypothetical protein
MRHNLNSPTKIVAFALAFNDMLVNLSRSNIILPCEGNIEVAFVVSEVEIYFTAIALCLRST